MGEIEEDFDKILKSEDAEFMKDEEITRILKAFKLDAYAVLDILPGCTVKDIRNTFRRKSLLIHPDKTTNSKAPGMSLATLLLYSLQLQRRSTSSKKLKANLWKILQGNV